MAMEFWGVEVKQGQSLKVTPEHDKIIHISQASLGEIKDDKASIKVPMRLKIGGKNFVIGTLSAGDRPQIMFDLVFEKEFELSHDWKNGSVYFIGYQTLDPCLDDEDDGEEFDFESDDEELPIESPENGKLEPKVDAVKPAKKPSATVAVPSKKLEAKPVADPKKVEPESDDDSDDEDEDGEDSDESMEDGDSDEEDDSEEDESDEETPVKGKPQMKKRPAQPLPETRAPAKKAKQAKQPTPDKSGGKKGGPSPGAKQPQKSPQSFNNSNKKPQKKFNQRKH